MIASQVDNELIGLVMTHQEASVLKWLLANIEGDYGCVYYQDLDEIYTAMENLRIPETHMDCVCKTTPEFEGPRADSPTVHATMIEDNLAMVLTVHQAATLKIVYGGVSTRRLSHPIRAITRPCYLALDKLSVLNEAAKEALDHRTGRFTFEAPNQ